MKYEIKNEVWIGLALFLLLVFFLKEAYSFGEGSKYPTVILSALAFLSAGLLLQGVYYTIKNHTCKKEKNVKFWSTIQRPAICFCLVTIYTIIIKFVDFFISTAVFVPLSMISFGDKNIRNIILTTIGVEIFIYIVFVQILSVNFALI